MVVDLQRSIGWIWNTVGGWMQGERRNSDIGALTDCDRSQIFSAPDSGENIIRSDFPSMKPVNRRPAGTGPSFSVPQRN
jgi:hypothetical protein